MAQRLVRGQTVGVEPEDLGFDTDWDMKTRQIWLDVCACECVFGSCVLCLDDGGKAAGRSPGAASGSK